MQPTLLILAAGMGSRYGGLKQIDPMGPNGETVLDYSVFDAIRAGFGKVVFVIRRDFADAFKTAVGDKFRDRIEVAYAFQELHDLPEGFTITVGREKPWGTAHAVRAARNDIDSPFAVINADDFYGQDAYQQLADYFNQSNDEPELRTCMVGYRLENTLSEHGSVNRGLCLVEDGFLKGVEEHTVIAKGEDGIVRGSNLTNQRVNIAADAIVSMNFWGFTPALFASLEAHFVEFLGKHGSEMKSECYIPTVIDELIQSEQTDCAVIETSGSWFGVTYPDDKPFVQSSIQTLIASGEYPANL
ncbi:MAG: NTP transferase domain-containing protein [Opitutales bacterium]|jgi:NDP-sugar pyrophosphorylase family protein|nr:NTP transferase domain-containing protein [Opitutales bacterium]MDP4693803.1 NTP transferase domain-containing protein [Opitutales bacterium]MDP4778364.1 NTP transferase domain-containing protein [Opitutales bacterium]MDP4884055.1 NTP transferase domain-containing protein [Opitutales bacterium]MDP5080630.1 NTP transferase domain-containing protein [Opitutales bacterium]